MFHGIFESAFWGIIFSNLLKISHILPRKSGKNRGKNIFRTTQLFTRKNTFG